MHVSKFLFLDHVIVICRRQLDFKFLFREISYLDQLDLALAVTHRLYLSQRRFCLIFLICRLFKHLGYLLVSWLRIRHLTLTHRAQNVVLRLLYHPLILLSLENVERTLDEVLLEQLLDLHDVCAHFLDLLV